MLVDDKKLEDSCSLVKLLSEDNNRQFLDKNRIDTLDAILPNIHSLQD